MNEIIENRLKQVVIAFLFILSLNHYFFLGNSFGTISTFNFFIFVSVYMILDFSQKQQIKRRIKKYSYILSTIYSFGLCFGKLINDTNKIDAFFTVQGFLWMTVSIVAFSLVFGNINSLFLYKLCLQKQKDFDIANWRGNKYIYFICWAFLFVMWIPCYLAYYPGILEYDMFIQTYQASGVIPVNQFHPPLHTLFWRLCLWGGERTGIEPVTIYALIQMLVISALYSRVICYFIKSRVQNWLVNTMICFFTLNPVIAIFSIIPTKDVLFSAFFFVTAFEIYRFVSDSKKYCAKKENYAWLFFSIVFSCLFRNNALYVFILSIPFFIISFQRQWKSILVLFVAPVIVFLFINSIVFPNVGIEKGDVKEMLSVPIQQITLTAVTHDSELSEETKTDINRYLPYSDIINNYNPRFADPVKELFQTEQFKKDKVHFIKLWLSLLVQYPKEYISAVMSLNLPYWYPDALSVDPYSGRKYIETGITVTDVYTFERDSKLPWLLEMYEKVADYSAFEGKPFVANFFSIATPVWVLVFCTIIFAVQERKKMILVLLPSFFLWLTHIAGPVSNFRYILALFVQYPLFLMILFGSMRGRIMENR